MIYYAVIDTNVIVSSFLKKGSIPDQVVSLALDGPIIPLIHEDILKEYKDVLLRNKFDLPEQDINDFISDLVDRAHFLDTTKTDEMFIDQKDIVFYEITLTAKKEKDAYLITGNKKHFPNEPFIVTPREMLDIIENAKASD
ncbi:MAG: putative toxin-antitoxin system toxin component, PIN family [Erysipelotrichaceae bacterium]|nr:putative toxin-antitoxin system toxin component, PIN family [Erysipelotrichaceae bacterium]